MNLISCSNNRRLSFGRTKYRHILLSGAGCKSRSYSQSKYYNTVYSKCKIVSRINGVVFAKWNLTL